MESQLKPKVTARVDYDRARPTSPFKLQSATLSQPMMAKPKAKVNTSAQITTRKQPQPRGLSPSPVTRSSGIPPPRAASPFKQVHIGISHSVSVNNVVKARVTARPTSGTSPSVTESRARALTTIPSDPALSARARPRRGSVSSHVSSAAPSHAEFHAARSVVSHAEENGSTSSVCSKGIVRVKSKVSKMAEPNTNAPLSSPSPPSTKGAHSRGPSIPSISIASPLLPANINTSPPQSAIPHHRFATTRESPTQRLHAFQAFPLNDDSTVSYNGCNVSTKVDPSVIPLPPQSPPMSAISLSSRSSASRSSVSYETQSSGMSRSTAPTVHSRVNGQERTDRTSPPRGSLDGLGIHPELVQRDVSSPSDGSWDDDPGAIDAYEVSDSEDPDRKLRNEAKSNRKIADLEITNRSLLTINSSLEAAKHRQAREIRDLKRKLRESRLILPPPAYRAVKSSLPADDTVEDEEDGEDDDDDEEEILEGKDDETYRRVKVMVDSLLDSGRRALESKPEDFVGTGKGGAKVLTAEEVRSWRGDMSIDGDVDISMDLGDESFHLEADNEDKRPILKSSILPADDNKETDDNDSATYPPIAVTSS